MEDEEYPESVPELPPPPRNVEFTSEVRGSRALLKYLAALYVVVVAIAWLPSHLKILELQKTGVRVKGVINYKYTGRGVASGSYLDYKYSFASEKFTNYSEVPSNYYERAKVGDPITIYVLPGDPSYHSVGLTTQENVNAEIIGLAILSIFVLGIMGITAVCSEIKFNRHANILKNWEAVPATVTRVIKSGGGHCVFFSYCHSSSSKQEKGVSYGGYTDLSPGSETVLLCDPKKPGECIPYENISFVRIVGEL